MSSEPQSVRRIRHLLHICRRVHETDHEYLLSHRCDCRYRLRCRYTGSVSEEDQKVRAEAHLISAG